MFPRTFLKTDRRRPAVIWVAAGTLLLASASYAQPDRKKASKALNLFEKHKDEYVATGKPALVDTGPANYLTSTGKGEPGGELFKKRIGAMYSVAYSLKMKNQFSGRNYTVCPLEGLWWGTKSEHSFLDEPKATWNWKLLIRTPDFIKGADVAAAVGQMAKQGRGSDAEKITLETLDEGRCVQMLHIGPYDKEAEHIHAMAAYAKKQGLALNGPHHEIYLSDPNRTPPEQLQTILRQPVK